MVALDEGHSSEMDASHFLRRLLAVKKQQAALLFSAWDTEECGRIRLCTVQPLLDALFPSSCPSDAYGKEHSQNRGPGGGIAGHSENSAVSISRIRSAYTAVTCRPWSTVASTIMPSGSTLSEVCAVIDHLFFHEEQEDSSSSRIADAVPSGPRCSSVELPNPLTEADFFGEEQQGTTPRCSTSMARAEYETEKFSALSQLKRTPAFRLLSGSLEQVYRECVQVTGGDVVTATGMKVHTVEEIQHLTRRTTGSSLDADVARAVRALFESKKVITEDGDGRGGDSSSGESFRSGITYDEFLSVLMDC